MPYHNTFNDFFSPVSTETAHSGIDELITAGELSDPGSISAADPWWNKYIQAKESLGDWALEMFPPSPGVEPGTPRYEEVEDFIRNLPNFFLPSEKWELPLYGLGMFPKGMRTKGLMPKGTSDLTKAVGGNKAAAQRVRVNTVALEKVAKLYRKESVSSGGFLSPIRR